MSGLNIDCPLLGEKQVSAILGVTVSALRGWRLRGQGPAFLKLGGAVRYARADLDAYLASARRGGAT